MIYAKIHVIHGLLILNYFKFIFRAKEKKAMNKKKLNKVISAVTMPAALLAVGPVSYKGNKYRSTAKNCICRIP